MQTVESSATAGPPAFVTSVHSQTTKGQIFYPRFFSSAVKSDSYENLYGTRVLSCPFERIRFPVVPVVRNGKPLYLGYIVHSCLLVTNLQ